jgi:transposase
LQVNYGLLTDHRGCPVAVSVHEGHVSDSTTFLPEVQRLRSEFGIGRRVMVGDRGMIPQKAIDAMQGSAGLDWIHHCLADRVRSHIFLCMLAYYVEWHMREAWRELMFADPDQEAKAVRDPRGARPALPGGFDQNRSPYPRRYDTRA